MSRSLALSLGFVCLFEMAQPPPRSKVFTVGMSMGRSRRVSAAPNVSNPGDGSGQILKDVEAANVLSQLYLTPQRRPKPVRRTVYKMT